MKQLLRAPLLFLLATCASSTAFAHSTSTSFLILDAPGPDRPVAVRWDLSLHDLVWMVFIDANYDGTVTWQELKNASPAITSAIKGELKVSRGDAACALTVQDIALAKRTEQNYVSVATLATCPGSGALTVGGTLFMNGDASQRALLSATRGTEQFTGVISPGTPMWAEPEHASAWGSFARFVGEGVWHVLIGYDHIAFVLLLLLPSVLRPVDGKWQGVTSFRQVTRDIVTIVTAFTIAHSTTLALAVTGIVKLPTQPIEVAIAASIAVAAALNLMPKLSKWRLLLAFSFGFVHGFGFANALNELDAGGTTLLPLLAGFNIGVEIAQLGIVATVLPFIYLARGTRWYAGGVMPLGSCALGMAGLVWLIQRL